MPWNNMCKPDIKLIQALSTKSDDVCFESLLERDRLTFNEIECEYHIITQEWEIASWDYNEYNRISGQERKYVECFSRYLKQFEKDIP